MRGGSRRGFALLLPLWGLSPRARGKLKPGRAPDPEKGSIPACAGEAASPGMAVCCLKVYPRVRGGSGGNRRRPAGRRGLSPRARGKRRLPAGALRPAGSIPACAGEAFPRRALRIGRGVYPRVRGGSWVPVAAAPARSGLSPRARGKLHRALGAYAETGSIPACAGEAAACPSVIVRTEVYPRVRGGSGDSFQQVRVTEGLSPRARGKRRPALR